MLLLLPLTIYDFLLFRLLPFLLSFLKSAPVILSRGGATLAIRIWAAEYFFLPDGLGITRYRV